ncbi:MAG TPA: hypothetical protein PK916_13345 [Bacteroidota bacterium]|nr:hypothetical protein [Bacteroidota bacterium]
MIKFDKSSLLISISTFVVIAGGVAGGAFLAQLLLESWNDWIGGLMVALSFGLSYSHLIYFILQQKGVVNTKYLLTLTLVSAVSNSFILQMVFQIMTQ